MLYQYCVACQRRHRAAIAACACAAVDGSLGVDEKGCSLRQERKLMALRTWFVLRERKRRWRSGVTEAEGSSGVIFKRRSGVKHDRFS